MVDNRWLSPRRLLFGSVGLVASCAALGLSVSSARQGFSAKDLLAPFDSNHLANAQAALMLPSHVASAAGRPPCRDGMVLVERTCVDRYEAHLLETAADGSLSVHPPEQQPEKKRYVAASSAGSKPQAYICQVDAAAACENAGKRLCSLKEWYRACTGSKPGNLYPYGAKYQAGRCNVGKPHLLSMLHGDNVNNWSYRDFNDPKLALTPGFLALTGEYADCESNEGVHDMVGNLHEWVADRVDATLKFKLPVKAVIQRRVGRHAGNGIFMGGFFSTMNQHGEGCTFATAAHDPHYHDYSTGFRCCEDASSP
jgi:sulfatase-modifying factor enzyme 1